MRIRRRDALPADAAARLALTAGERVLASSPTRDGGWCVGTLAACHIISPDDVRRLPWEQIERADWDADSDTLTIVETADWGEREQATPLVLDDPGPLLELVRERVTKSVVISRFTRVSGKRGLSVVGRRSPTGQGEISWSYVVSLGLDPDDPDVADVAAAALQEAQAELAGL